MALLPSAAYKGVPYDQRGLDGEQEESASDIAAESSRDNDHRNRDECREDVRRHNEGLSPVASRRHHLLGSYGISSDISPSEPSRHRRSRQKSFERRLLLKLDIFLLPLLCLLFLINSLDRSNIGNAETAHFTRDVGLDEKDLNLAVAVMYAFFVVMQPFGAALGRSIGMSVWVPLTMGTWGICTVAHIWVTGRWGLVALRGVIGCLEAGFYPTAVSYLSLFYTRYEFGRRLALFYGSAGLAGALGGVLAFIIFSRYDLDSANPTPITRWKPWQLLFLVEGGVTIIAALVGFFWLPRSASTAWFLTQDEADWAEERVRIDRENPKDEAGVHDSHDRFRDDEDAQTVDEERRLLDPEPIDDGASSSSELGIQHQEVVDEAQSDEREAAFQPHLVSDVTKDSGLSKHDILSTILFLPMVLPILLLNILSAIPATAFSVFLPLVISSMNISSPLHSNILTVPPFLLATITLFLLSWWSDKTHQRITPLLYSLGVILVGLVLIMGFSAMKDSATRSVLSYISLCILLSGSYVPSPLTTTWLAGNIPSPGKRAIVLGINGYGNVAGILSSLLFAPAYKSTVYRLPFLVTFLCIITALAGFWLLRVYLLRVNISRAKLAAWYTLECQENAHSNHREIWKRTIKHAPRWAIVGGAKWDQWVRNWIGCRMMGLEIEECYVRRGDEAITYEYEL